MPIHRGLPYALTYWEDDSYQAETIIMDFIVSIKLYNLPVRDSTELFIVTVPSPA